MNPNDNIFRLIETNLRNRMVTLLMYEYSDTEKCPSHFDKV